MRKAVLLCLLLALVTLAASASTTPTPMPLNYFETSGPGLITPCFFIGFNQVPAGTGPLVDLSNPTQPKFTQPGAGEFSLLFGINDDAGDMVTYGRQDSAPTVTADGSVFKFDVMVGPQNFEVDYNIHGFQSDWASFNPQPDPPGYQGDTLGFTFTGDPWVTVEIFALDANGTNLGPLTVTQAPEPSSLMLLGAGLLGCVGIRRKMR